MTFLTRKQLDLQEENNNLLNSLIKCMDKNTLIRACRQRELAPIKYFYENDIDIGWVKSTNLLNDLFSEACDSGSLEIVKYLHSKGANPNIDESGNLRTAAIRNQLDIVKYLLSQGADPVICYAIGGAMKGKAWNTYNYLIEYHKEHGIELPSFLRDNKESESESEESEENSE